MVPVRARPPGTAWRVVFDGQSRNSYPQVFGETYPERLMSGRSIPWENVSVAAAPWATLINDDQTRLHPQFNHATNDVLIMCGGETDLALDLTGQQIYDSEVAYADAARAAGATYVLSCTMCGFAGMTGGQPTARQNFNTLVLADASDAFDGVADLDATVLADWTNTTYYIDGDIHWTAAGAQIAADTFAPLLDAILEDDMITPDNLTSFNAAYGTTITAYDQEFEAVSSSLPSGWSWLNQGTATYQEHLGAGVVTMPAGAGVNWRGITRALPTESTWTATAKISASGKYVTGNYIGLLVRENSSGKFIPISRYMVAPGGGGDENVYTDRWTNSTTYGSAIANATMFDRASYFRVRRNSATSYDFEASTDGLSWFPLSLAYDVSAFMTPDQIGLAGNFQGNAVGGMALQWFRVR